jgi:hypothetical protein
MSFLGKLFGSTAPDPNRLLFGLKSILDNERGFDASTREIFWQSHIDKCRQWQQQMNKILLQSPDQDTPQEAGLRIPPSNHVAQASELAGLVSIIDFALDKVDHYDPARAASNPDCLRLVAFSNVISYVATSGKDVSFVDMDKLWARSCQELKVAPIPEGSYEDFYRHRGEQQSATITLSPEELELLRLASADFVSSRGPTPQDGWQNVPTFVRQVINDISAHVRAGGSQTIRLTPPQRDHMVLLLDEQIRLLGFRTKGQWPWHNRPLSPVPAEKLQQVIRDSEALRQRLTTL